MLWKKRLFTKPYRSCQRNIVRGEQPGKAIAGEKFVFALALIGQRIEADQGVIDKTRVTHDEAALRQAFYKLPHQLPEIRRFRKIIGAGECRIEGDLRTRRAAPETRAQDVEQQRLGRTEPPRQRLTASALTYPGLGRGFLHRREK